MLIGIIDYILGKENETEGWVFLSIFQILHLCIDLGNVNKCPIRERIDKIIPTHSTVPAACYSTYLIRL